MRDTRQDLDKIKRNAIQYLQSFKNEPELRKKIIIPLFKSMNYDVEDVHKKRESRHHSDLLITPRTNDGHLLFHGIQVKHKIDIDNNQSLVDEISSQGAHAQKFSSANKDFGIYFWITTGKITNTGKNLISEAKKRGELNKIKIWDVEALVNQINKHKPELIADLEIYNLLKSREEHIGTNRLIFASHCSYLLFKKYFQEKKFSKAKECLEDAKDYLEKEEEHANYFYRTLRKYYEYWEIILDYDTGKLESIIDSLIEKDYFFIKIARTNEIIDHVKKEVGSNLSHLLIHMEFIFNQLDILAKKFVNTPLGLASLSILRLLMRMGYSTQQYKEIEKRIDRIKEELEKEEMKSIDGKCTLCTGVAISCLSLAKQKEVVSGAVAWIKQLKPQKYCFEELSVTTAFPHQHAMQYTASVFQGVMDYGKEELIQDVREEFFKSNITDMSGFYKDWMLYRNISAFEVSSYIFSSFLKYFLSTQQELNDNQNAHLFRAVLNLVEKLYIESVPEISPFRLHATRENLQSLCLGLILQGENISYIPWVKELINALGKKIDIHIHKKDYPNLMQASVERTQRIVEGWLSYWETLLFLQEKGRDIQPLLPDEQSI